MAVTPPGTMTDPDRTGEVTRALVRRRPGFVPEWRTGTSGVDHAMTSILARFVRTISERIDQAPRKHGLAMLDLLGVRLIPARAARAPIVFALANKAADARVPAGTRIAAPPPPGSNDQVIFELEEALGVAVARLDKVVSVWPGRDQYLDHTAAVQARQPYRPFSIAELEGAPHALYIAHPTMLALSGTSRVDLAIELATQGSERLRIEWQFWDGKLWREFSRAQLDCDDQDDAGPNAADGTGGFTRSGTLRLESDGGKAQTTSVNGVESYWVRGKLDQPLPPDPARILPEIDRIRLTTQIAQPLRFDWDSRLQRNENPASEGLVVRVQDDTGGPLPGVVVDTSMHGPDPTNGVGEVPFPIWSEDTASVTVGGERAEQLVSGGGLEQLLTFVLTARGLKLDKAVADELPVDVTKPFLPFGPQPQAGAAFYFSNDEAFSKPGARMQVFVQTAEASPAPPGGKVLPHSVAWEYWNGDDWRLLLPPVGTNDPGPDDFTATGVLGNDIVIPDDMVPTRVANQEARWMRVRLASGSYAVQQSISLTGTVTGGTGTGTGTNSFTFSVPRPPIVARLLLGYTWPQGPYAPEHVVAHNDFEYVDRSTESRWPGATFLPFTTMAGTPALYLGFSEALPVDRLGILFDIEEVRGEELGPALQWSYWDGIAWASLVVDDETQHLAQPGIVQLIGQPDSAPLARFDATLHWVRAALAEDGRPALRTHRGVFLNAGWASQQLTVVDEPIGASTGEPDQVLTFRQRPVLPGPEIAIRELEGMRANVEWRILVREAFPDDPRAVNRFEGLLAAEGTGTELEWRRVRLVRDRNKRVREVWMPWTEQPHLAFSGPGDRDYVVDFARGRVLFGDGIQGRIPPLGGAVVARRYRTGGGAAGNLKANTITQLLAPLGGMESVTNTLPAEGGSDGERPDALTTRGSATLHHRGRAVAASDCATLAIESSAAVGRAWVLPATASDGVKDPGWVTLVVVPRATGPTPSPTFGLREEVRRFVLDRAPAALAAGRRLIVTGPDYHKVGVDATIVPVQVSESGAVKQRALDALTAFLHPLIGGPDGAGWTPGQPVYLSDVASVLEGCRGVDHVVDAAILVGGTPQGVRADVGAGRVVAAGPLRLRMVEE